MFGPHLLAANVEASGTDGIQTEECAENYIPQGAHRFMEVSEDFKRS